METNSSTTTRTEVPNLPDLPENPLERLLRESESSDDEDRKPPRRIHSGLRWFVVLLLAVLFAYGEWVRTAEPGSVLLVVVLSAGLMGVAAFVEIRLVRTVGALALVAVAMHHVQQGASPLSGMAAVVLATFLLVLAVARTDAELK
jgi:uncharacterized membrane protein YccC